MEDLADPCLRMLEGPGVESCAGVGGGVTGEHGESGEYVEFVSIVGPGGNVNLTVDLGVMFPSSGVMGL